MEIQKALYYYYQYLAYFLSEVSKMAALFQHLHIHLYSILIISWFPDIFNFADS